MRNGEPKARTRIGALSIFGLCVLLMTVASQMISVEDANEPAIVVHDDSRSSMTNTTPAAKILGGGDPVEAKVLGATLTQDSLDPGDDLGVEGVVLGEWIFGETGDRGRYVLSQTLEGTRLTLISSEGTSIATPLAERAFSGGRLFTLGGNAPADFVIFADDGSLHFGNTDGVWATFTTQR